MMEHANLAEQALGKSLPAGSEVHHANGERRDNSRGNLVICQDRKYHRLLHQRMAALQACGHADWRKCRFCKQYDDLKNLYVRENNAHHRACFSKYERDKRHENRTEAQIADDEQRAAGKRKCWICKKWDEPEKLYVQGNDVRHRECQSRYQREKRASIRNCV